MARQPRQLVSRWQGFTLVELMTVIVIITLLAGILVPTVSSIIKSGEQTKTWGRMEALNAGCLTYWETFGRRYYPGADEYATKIGAPPKIPGSAYLALKLYCLSGTATLGSSTVYQTTPYANYSPDYVGDVTGIDKNVKHYALSDMTSKPMAICYYVSRPGTLGVTQYDINDNSDYTTTSGNFINVIQQAGFSGSTVVRDQLFLLIAPGIDRTYFTTDDARNW